MSRLLLLAGLWLESEKDASVASCEVGLSVTRLQLHCRLMFTVYTYYAYANSVTMECVSRVALRISPLRQRLGCIC